MKKKIYVCHVLNEYRDCGATSTVLDAVFTREEAEVVRQREWDGMFDEDGQFDEERVKAEHLKKEQPLNGAWTCADVMGGEEYAEIDIAEITYDTAVFEFRSDKYDYINVMTLSREECERLANLDEESVTKYDESVESLINDDKLDTTNCWFRVFE